MLVNETYYVKTEEKEHTVKIQNKDEKFYSYDAELVENPTGTLVEKTITENGEYLPIDDDADGYSKVTVDVPSSDLPTLYPPVINGGINEVSWQNNAANGSFGVLSAVLDGVSVTSPLTITQEMDGKTLSIIATEENFNSANTTITLSYMSSANHVVAVGTIYDNKSLYLKEITNVLAFSSGDETNNRRILSWDKTVGTQTFQKEITIAKVSGSSCYFSASVTIAPNVGRELLFSNEFSANYHAINGTITIKNVTKNQTKTWTYNNSYTTSSVSISGWEVGDIVQFAINIS